MGNNDDFLEGLIVQFVEQSDEDINLMINDVFAIKDSPYNREIICDVFRVLHSLKGHSSLLGFFKLKALVHLVEDIVANIRDSQEVLSSEMVDLLLPAFNLMRDSIELIGEHGGECSTLDDRYDFVVDRLSIYKREFNLK